MSYSENMSYSLSATETNEETDSEQVGLLNQRSIVRVRLNFLWWRKLESKSPKIQKRFFAHLNNKFKRESVSSCLQNIKKGDHLVCKGLTNFLFGYEHHFLCTEVNSSEKGSVASIEVIEYTGGGGLSANPIGFSGASLSSDLTGLGKIKENTYTYEELKKKKVEKENWPKVVERFDVDEVIKRAKSRVGEAHFDVLQNNCEQFVRWCKYGLNVSLQVKSWYLWARLGFYSLVAGGKECVLKVFGKLMISPESIADFASDELVESLSGTFAAVDVAVPLGIGFALEIGVCSYQIKKALNQRKKRLIENDKLLRAKIAGIVVKGVLRYGLGAAGSVVGLIFGGPLGSLIGGATGGILGHLIGSGIAWCCNKIIRISQYRRRRNQYRRIKHCD